jgi:hypothetical protein
MFQACAFIHITLSLKGWDHVSLICQIHRMASRYSTFKALELGVCDGFERLLCQNKRQAFQPCSYCNKELGSYSLSYRKIISDHPSTNG